MNIVLDAFGGDNAPLEIIKGAIDAHKGLSVDITLVGMEDKIKKCAEDNSLDISGLKIRHAPDVIEICDDAMTIRSSKSESSMAVGLKMVAAGEGDAFVSAGSTAALVVGATLIVKRIKGIKRAALATVLPTEAEPFMLLDSGANADCKPEMLLQFGIMGSAYMNKVMKFNEPTVGLANIGSEESKGRELELASYKLLQEAPINFIGNVEARELPRGNCRVVVADGFTGNMLLKLYEGMGKFIGSEMKKLLTSSLLSKIGALFLMKNVKAFRKRMDYKEYGGAPLLGAGKPVIKAHGSSDAKAIYNAVRQAKEFTEGNVISEVTKALEIIKEKQSAAAAAAE